MTDYSDRVDLFQNLSVDELNQKEINEVFSLLLVDGYDDFIRLCEYAKSIKQSISNVSLSMTENGEIHFDIALANGQKHE